jgi:hypothetical protein
MYVQRVMGARPEHQGKDAASQGPTDGARGAPWVLRTGHAHPHPALGSHLCGERGGSQREGGVGVGQGTRAWQDETDGEGLQQYGGSATYFYWLFRTIR